MRLSTPTRRPTLPTRSLPTYTASTQGNAGFAATAAVPSPESLDRAARLVELALNRPAIVVGRAPSDIPDRRSGLHGSGRVIVASVRVGSSDGAAPSWVYRLHETTGSSSALDRAAMSLAKAHGAISYAAIPLDEPRHEGTGVVTTGENALCILSREPHEWTESERKGLVTIASSLAVELRANRELAESRSQEEVLRRRTLRDTLTGLPNRALFLDRIDHAVIRARRHKDFRFAVLSLDLDRFKGINDSLGMDIADQVLVIVARRLEACLRGEDMLARLSGDEFAILLESIADDSDGGRVAERILRALAVPIPTDAGEVMATASIGVALSSSGIDPGPEAAMRLVQRSAAAMTRAKQGGRARYEMFDREMHARAVARLKMETDLRLAVERGEFELFYQPLITLETGRITELEALVRWRHPVRGLVPPLEFIPLAEETGLIVPIGTWVLGEACRQMREWQERFPRDTPLSVSVNLSVRQFIQPDFVRHVADVVRASGLDPHCLKLEITESFAIDDPKGTRGMLQELRELGVRIYLDDFGTGYSSLGYLHQLPLDAIKIDRSFVMQMNLGGTHLQLVRTVRSLAQNIGVFAVAEGVETAEQLDTLRAMGCESAQGYLFSKPISAREAGLLLELDPHW